MKTLGHSQIALTMNAYAHVLPEGERAAVDYAAQRLSDDPLVAWLYEWLYARNDQGGRSTIRWSDLRLWGAPSGLEPRAAGVASSIRVAMRGPPGAELPRAAISIKLAPRALGRSGESASQ